MIDNYNELSVGKYLRVLELCEDKSLDNVERQVAILSVLSGKTEDEILNLPLPEYMEMSGKLKFLEKSPDLPESPAKSYKVGKWVLVPVADIRNMTAAQYIDFQTFAAQDGSRTVEIISCMVVPEGMKYNDGYDIVELQNDIREMMPVTDAMSLYAFFFKLVKTVNIQYPNLFGSGHGRDEETPEGENPDGQGDDEGSDPFTKKWNWIACVDTVSETCRCSWSKVWEMNVIEFLNMICYTSDKAEKRKRDIEDWKRRH